MLLYVLILTAVTDRDMFYIDVNTNSGTKHFVVVYNKMLSNDINLLVAVVVPVPVSNGTLNSTHSLTLVECDVVCVVDGVYVHYTRSKVLNQNICSYAQIEWNRNYCW